MASAEREKKIRECWKHGRLQALQSWYPDQTGPWRSLHAPRPLALPPMKLKPRTDLLSPDEWVVDEEACANEATVEVDVFHFHFSSSIQTLDYTIDCEGVVVERRTHLDVLNGGPLPSKGAPLVALFGALSKEEKEAGWKPPSGLYGSFPPIPYEPPHFNWKPVLFPTIPVVKPGYAPSLKVPPLWIGIDV